MPDLPSLLDELVRALGTQQAVADAIGISTGRVGRIRRGEHSLDVLNCLRLAQLTRRNPSDVLRVAGKGDVADAIEAMYGAGAAELEPDERAVIQQWSRVPDDAKPALRLVIDRFALAKPPEADQPRFRRARRRGTD